METYPRNVTLVLGGVRSGKSRYAQILASRYRRVTFLATARPSDREMRERIAMHRRDRPASWKTVEAPLDLPKTITAESLKADLLLVDCLTLFVANAMTRNPRKLGNARLATEQVCQAIRSSRASVIVVSNEVGSGIVPAYRSGRIYRDLLGQMNQEIAKIADRVVFMIAGIPLTIKGQRRKGAGDRE
jgi:adenosylcobinamide kinase / adenosylcobinamide-phosphate guanylyltransferase